MVVGFIAAAAIAVSLSAALTIIEMLTPRQRFTVTSRLRGFAFTGLSVFAGGLLTAAFILLWQQLGIRPVLTLPLRGLVGDVVAGAAGVIFADLLAYWNHRFQHKFIWPVHALHHSQTELHAANYYGHFSEGAFRFVLFALPLSLVHFEFASTPFVIAVARDTLERFIHSPTTINFGPLARVLVEPRYHRIHHSTDPRHFDKNFGILFSFWDRLFGTAYTPTHDDWPSTGIDGIPPPQNCSRLLPVSCTIQGSRQRTPDHRLASGSVRFPPIPAVSISGGSRPNQTSAATLLALILGKGWGATFGPR